MCEGLRQNLWFAHARRLSAGESLEIIASAAEDSAEDLFFLKSPGREFHTDGPEHGKFNEKYYSLVLALPSRYLSDALVLGL